MKEEVLKREAVSREAHARLWDENRRLRRELLAAQSEIVKLKGGRLDATITVYAGPKLDVPGQGKQPIVIGIVQCPKCGQFMEVEK
jgi:hypothetical protein